MKTKFTQSLPLLGTFLALIIGGAVLFKFTPADAVLDAEAADVPPDTAVSSDDVIVTVPDAEPTPTPDAERVDPRVITAHDTTIEVDTTAKVISGIYAEADSIVTLDDHYLNDVYLAGDTITITGTVDGDVFAVGNSIVITGTVQGSVRAAGNTIEISGAVGRNVIAFGSRVDIKPTAHIGEDVMLMAEQGFIDAMVMGNVSGMAGEVNIDAPVEGDINLPGVEAFSLGSNAYVMGDVFYRSGRTAKIDDEATVLGEVEFELEAQEAAQTAIASGAVIMTIKIVITLIAWLGFMILGIVVLKLMPVRSRAIIARMRTSPAASFGYGALVLIAGPIALVIIAVTIIGLPLATAGFLTFALLMMLAKIFLGATVGKLLLPNSKSLAGPFLLGFTLVYLGCGIIGLFGLVGILIGKAIFALGVTWALGSIVTHGRNL